MYALNPDSPTSIQYSFQTTAGDTFCYLISTVYHPIKILLETLKLLAIRANAKIATYPHDVDSFNHFIDICNYIIR
jgi:hypothetical protein